MASIKVSAGTTFTMGYTYTKSTDNKTFLPFSLVGCIVRFTVKKVEFDSNSTDTTALIKKDITVPNNADALLGKTQIILTPVDTAITPGTYYFDIKVEEPPINSIEQIFKTHEGSFVVDGSPTNRKE